MSTRTLRRTLVAVLATAAIALLPVAAQAAPAGALRGAEPGFEGGVSSMIYWAYMFFQSVWGAEGASLDPNGLVPTGIPEGGSLDPDGASFGSGEEGGSLDSNGFVAPGDEGASLDPNG